MGAANIKAKNDSIINSNRKLVMALSKPIAVVNKPFFQRKMVEKLPPDISCHIRVCDEKKGEKPICDTYGRVTFFYAKIAD